MLFHPPLIRGTLLQRYKRFLADVELPDGTVVTAHCPNPGRMTTCATPGWEVRLSEHTNPRRKLRHTLELVHNGRCWIGVNTHIANRIAVEAITQGVVDELQGYETLETEVPYGESSRIDIRLRKRLEQCYVEVKNVTLIGSDGAYCFPDAVTKRGSKHLRELLDVVRGGQRGVMLFVIQRSDGTCFRAAPEVDPEYAATFAEAAAGGVEVLAYRASVSPAGVRLLGSVEVAWPGLAT